MCCNNKRWSFRFLIIPLLGAVLLYRFYMWQGTDVQCDNKCNNKLLISSSLYVWSSEENRDHPSTIKKRFFSVFIVMLLSPFFVYFFSSPDLFKHFTIWEVMGLRKDGLLSALVIPFLLTMVLFLGPLSVQLTNGIWKIYSGIRLYIMMMSFFYY